MPSPSPDCHSRLCPLLLCLPQLPGAFYSAGVGEIAHGLLELPDGVDDCVIAAVGERVRLDPDDVRAADDRAVKALVLVQEADVAPQRRLDRLGPGGVAAVIINKSLILIMRQLYICIYWRGNTVVAAADIDIRRIAEAVCDEFITLPLCRTARVRIIGGSRITLSCNGICEALAVIRIVRGDTIRLEGHCLPAIIR